MTEAPEKIWTLAGNRQHWQNVPPQDGQKTWRWVEYTRSDIADTLRAEVARLREVLNLIALQQTSKEWECEGDTEYAYDTIISKARAALAHGEADQ
jgi:hypothetical protein